MAQKAHDLTGQISLYSSICVAKSRT